MKREEEGKKKSTADPKKERIRILVADDHGVVREGLYPSSSARRHDCGGEATKGREAVDLWKEHRRT